MPNLIFKISNYRNEDAIENVVNYIVNSDYIENVGMNGCFLYPGQPLSEGITNSFNAVKNVYYKNDRQLVQHIVVGFDANECIKEYEARVIASQISDYFFQKGFQTFWGVHWGSGDSDSYRHIHMAVNTINGMNGSRFFATFDDRNDLKIRLQSVYPGYTWCHYPSESFYHEY